MFHRSINKPYGAGNFIVTPPSMVAVISGPEQSRMVIGECSFQRWFIGEKYRDIK